MKTLVALLAVVLCTGCFSKLVSNQMIGADYVKQLPAETLARYSIHKCTLTAYESTIDGPVGTTYYLEQGETGLALYELNEDGKGARITNHWEADDGDHFFTMVKRSHAWEYIIPKDRKQPAKRLVYTGGAYSTATDGDLVKPVGKPSAICPMPLRK